MKTKPLTQLRELIASALKSQTNLSKSFQTFFIETMEFILTHTGRLNFTQMNEVMAVLRLNSQRQQKETSQLQYTHAKQLSDSRNSEKSSANSLSPSSSSQARRKYDSSRKTIVLRELVFYLDKI